MKPLTISSPDTVVLSLQDEIRRSEESRYDHRLHAVLLVAKGLSCPEVANLFGEARHSIVNWVQRFEADGFAGLSDKPHPGRPGRLTQQQLDHIASVLRGSPAQFGLSVSLWDGKSLSTYIRNRFDLDLSVRQSQRLFRQLGFRLRRPRPILSGADPDKQEAFKKTQEPTR